LKYFHRVKDCHPADRSSLPPGVKVHPESRVTDGPRRLKHRMRHAKKISDSSQGTAELSIIFFRC